MSRTSLSLVVLASLGLAACATSAPPVAPHSMSESQHEASASKEDAEAAKHAAQYDPKATASKSNCGGGAAARLEGSPCWTEVTNPTAAHLEEAKQHAKLAAEHRAASKALEDAEAKACVGIDPGDRDMSPFHHAADIAAVKVLGTPGAEKGIEVVFKPVTGLTVEGLQHIVDCHLARSAALGHVIPEMPYCPLVPKGATAKVSKAGDNLSVTITDADPQGLKEILARSKQLGI